MVFLFLARKSRRIVRSQRKRRNDGSWRYHHCGSEPADSVFSLFVPSNKEKAMNKRIEKVKSHFRRNAAVYIAVGVTAIEIAAGAAYAKKARARRDWVWVLPIGDANLDWLKGGQKNVMVWTVKGKPVANLVHEDHFDEFLNMMNGTRTP
jgi:hypothetical protein